MSKPETSGADFPRHALPPSPYTLEVTFQGEAFKASGEGDITLVGPLLVAWLDAASLATRVRELTAQLKSQNDALAATVAGHTLPPT